MPREDTVAIRRRMKKRAPDQSIPAHARHLSFSYSASQFRNVTVFQCVDSFATIVNETRDSMKYRCNYERTGLMIPLVISHEEDIGDEHTLSRLKSLAGE